MSAKRKVDYAFDAQRAVSRVDVLVACETLMQAGFVAEGIAVISKLVKGREDFRRLLDEAGSRP